MAGKTTQFGSLDEVLRLSSEIEGVAPCLDFSHWHARLGGLPGRGGFRDILDQVEAALGGSALENLHMHVSGIEYGKGGERRHLPLEESNFHYLDLLRALKEREVGGRLICESPNLEEDALLLQEAYCYL